MFEVYILRGAQGMGKTTMVDKIIKYLSLSPEEYAKCSADFHFIKKDGIYNFVASQLPQAHASCMKAFRLAIEKEVPFVFVDNTNIMKEWFMNYITFAQKRDYKVIIVDLFDLYDNPMDYLDKFAERNIHGVPKEGIKKSIEIYRPFSSEELKELNLEKFNLKVL